MNEFKSYPKMRKLEDFPEIIKPGETVFVTEKISGFLIDFVFSRVHETFFAGEEESEAGLETIEQILADYPIEETCRRFPGWILYGEIFGAGIKAGFDYSRSKPDFVLFDAFDSVNNRFVSPENLFAVANVGGLLLAPGLYHGPWDPEIVLPFASDESIFAPGCPSAGIVVRRRPEAEEDFGTGTAERVMLSYSNPNLGVSNV